MKAFGGYGFWLYKNLSQLYMHTDKIQTHILSFIYHIGSSKDLEPWTIYIESFNDGETYEVVLSPGHILFYKLTKCFHGRPKPFIGTWYTSIFVQKDSILESCPSIIDDDTLDSSNNNFEAASITVNVKNNNKKDKLILDSNNNPANFA